MGARSHYTKIDLHPPPDTHEGEGEGEEKHCAKRLRTKQTSRLRFHIRRHLRVDVRVDEVSDVDGFFVPLEFNVKSSPIVFELFFSVPVDVDEIRPVLLFGKIGVVGRVPLDADALFSLTFELPTLFVINDETELFPIDRFPICGDGDDGVGVPLLSSIKCPSASTLKLN